MIKHGVIVLLQCYLLLSLHDIELLFHFDCINYTSHGLYLSLYLGTHALNKNIHHSCTILSILKIESTFKSSPMICLLCII